MVKSKNSQILRVLTMSALLANGGIGAEKEKKSDSSINGIPSYKTAREESPTSDHHTGGLIPVEQATAVSNDNAEDVIDRAYRLLHRVNFDPILELIAGHRGLRPAFNRPLTLSYFTSRQGYDIRQTNKERKKILEEPRLIDLDEKPMESVRLFLKNARLYGVRPRLTVLNLNPDQLAEIRDLYDGNIEDIDWTYSSMPEIVSQKKVQQTNSAGSKKKDVEDEYLEDDDFIKDTKKTDKGWDDDEMEEDDFIKGTIKTDSGWDDEEDLKKIKINDTSWDDDEMEEDDYIKDTKKNDPGWDDEGEEDDGLLDLHWLWDDEYAYVDGPEEGVHDFFIDVILDDKLPNHYRPRVNRKYHPHHPLRNAVARGRESVRLAAARGRERIRLVDLVDPRGQEDAFEPEKEMLEENHDPMGIQVSIVPDDSDSGDREKATTSGWQFTPATNDPFNIINPSNPEGSNKGVQAHNLIKMFCRGQVAG